MPRDFVEGFSGRCCEWAGDVSCSFSRRVVQYYAATGAAPVSVFEEVWMRVLPLAKFAFNIQHLVLLFGEQHYQTISVDYYSTAM